MLIRRYCLICWYNSFNHFSKQINRRKNIDMLKQYKFPNIFQNIVGQIIPDYILQRMNRPDLIIENHSRYGSHQNSIKFSSQSDQKSMRSGYFGPKVRKKKLFTRSQLAQYTQFLANERKQFDENDANAEQNLSSNNPSMKNNNRLTEIISQKDKNILENQLQNHQSEVTVQASFPDIDQQQLEQIQRKKNIKRGLFRVRTSIDRPFQLSKIAEQRDQQLIQTIKRKFDNSSLNKIKIKSNGTINGVSPFRSQRSQQFSRFGTSRQQSIGKMSKIGNINTSRNIKNQVKRNNLKKKTVNFARSKQNMGSTPHMSRNASRKGTSFSNKSKISQLTKKTNKNKVNLKLARFKVQQNISDTQSLKTISVGTGKSVISINVDDQSEITSHRSKQKSVRSNHSILQTQRNLKFKNTLNRTRTAKLINHKQLLQVEKPFKSQKLLKQNSNFKITKKKDKQNILKRRKYSKTSKKSNASSQRKYKAKKALVSRVSIIKKNDDFEQKQVSINHLMTVPECGSLSQVVTRNKNPRALNKTNLRRTMQQDNVYDQLNDFLRFFHDREIVETQKEIPKKFNRPVVIADEIKRKQTCSRQAFDSENMCIDMGLKLTKKMNKLVQKKY